MAYATRQDIEDRYGSDVLPWIENPADPDGDEIVDEEAVNRAMSDAAAEIDPYLAVKYVLPLTENPDLLVRLSVDIAIYRITPDALGSTEERRQRYDDAVRTLKSIATGTMALGLSEPPASMGGGVVISGPERIFSRKTMAGL